ncbi:MAG TPA: hypothetical protein VFL83_16185 [Anaeromyxobacter sp.]|nr:hypothetical protein [Anaeromyxobacter sp.]
MRWRAGEEPHRLGAAGRKEPAMMLAFVVAVAGAVVLGSLELVAHAGAR